MLIVALAAGFLTAYAIKSVFFEENERQAIDDESVSGLTEQLLVANGDLSAGSELSALNVRLTLTPEEKAPRDGIFSFNGVSGRKISRDLKDGEPISLYDLEDSEQEEKASAGFVPPGCSIVPIVVSSATKENGNRNYLKTTKLNRIIKTGDVVDVLVVKEISSKSGPVALPRLTTEMVAENVAVFDVSDESRFGADGAVRVSTISALLTADQLEKVRNASEEGKIRIVLHGKSDDVESAVPSDVVASTNDVSVRSYYPPFEEPRKVSPPSSTPSLSDANQPFVISLPPDAPNLTDGESGANVDSNSNGGREASQPVGVSSPEQGFINNDFTIKLDEADDFGAFSEPSVSAEQTSSSAKWKVVDFNSPVAVPDEPSSRQNSLWLGELSFRPRERAVAEENISNQGETIPEQYERALAEDLTAESTEIEDEFTTGTQANQSIVEVASPTEDRAPENTADFVPTSSVKKYSPFLTVTPKRAASAPEKDKRRNGKRI